MHTLPPGPPVRSVKRKNFLAAKAPQDRLGCQGTVASRGVQEVAGSLGGDDIREEIEARRTWEGSPTLRLPAALQVPK